MVFTVPEPGIVGFHQEDVLVLVVDVEFAEVWRSQPILEEPDPEAPCCGASRVPLGLRYWVAVFVLHVTRGGRALVLRIRSFCRGPGLKLVKVEVVIVLALRLTFLLPCTICIARPMIEILEVVAIELGEQLDDWFRAMCIRGGGEVRFEVRKRCGDGGGEVLNIGGDSRDFFVQSVDQGVVILAGNDI